jgi:pyrimidine operon attenuation protein/uracil phosphoribosyltransferase
MSPDSAQNGAEYGAAATNSPTVRGAPADPDGQPTVAVEAQSVNEPATERVAKTILSATDIARVVDRIAHQILEKTSGAGDTILLGIPTRGVPLARRLAERIHAFEGVSVPVGALDVTLFRDDLRLRGTRALGRTELPTGGVDGRRIILVDDVLFSGRTVRAALDALGDLGRPRAVQLAVLVDRGHRELPIRADYVGKNIPTALAENVRVLLTETDGADEVRLLGGTR